MHHPTPPYSVWAPSASALHIVLNGETREMQRNTRGWWTIEREPVHGDRYGFLVDGDGPFPDPRSGWQPDGVHGLSAFVDHSRFTWTDSRWQAPPLAAAVIYEVHIGTFTPEGTFVSAIARLPYLVELGVTHVELMPVVEFPGTRGWGYDGVDLFAPHHAYGGPDGLKQFVDAAHAHGLAVILDVVYNHFGPVGNYLSKFGPYLTSRYKTPWGDAVNLDDAQSHEVRRFFCDNARHWLRDYHFDGLRLDAIHAFVDMSATHFLEQLTTEVDVLEAVTGRHLVLIAESDLNDPRVVRPREAHGLGLDAQWNDDYHHSVHALLTGERAGYYADFGSLSHLAAAIRNGFVYGGAPSAHRRRPHGRAPHEIPGWRFVVAAQNHDQIGNRAMGDRLGHLVSTGRAKVAAALLLTSPFVPLLFQGEEWGASTPFLYFTAHEDPDLAEQVRHGRRNEFAAFGWKPDDIPDPQAESTFGRSQLLWNELDAETHRELLDWYRTLIRLRHSTPELRDGRYEATLVEHDEDARWLVMSRGRIKTACNLSGVTCPMTLGRAARLIVASQRDVHLQDGSLMLPPDSVAILDAV